MKDDNWNGSPAFRELVGAIMNLAMAGHPNVPGVLRAIANDLEKNPPKPAEPESNIIDIETGKAR